MATTTSIRPVTGRWPSSAALWQETSLPLSVVVIPFASQQQRSPATTSTSTDANDGTCRPRPHRPPPRCTKLANIPKCLHCGAPQQEATHYPVHGGTANLCHLCGKVTSRQFEDQVLERREDLAQEDYRKRGVPGAHSYTVALPLSHTLTSSSSHKFVYSRPAMACPPVWWIVVDGTHSGSTAAAAASATGGSTSSSMQTSSATPAADYFYWNTTLASVLRNVCHSMPPHVHVGLLVSTEESLAVWDLGSAVPHVRHLPWHQVRLASGGGSHTGTATSTATTTSTSMSSTTLLPLSPVVTSNLQAALRALGDASSCACWNGNDNISTSSTGDANNASTSSSSSGMPLGATIQVILNTMQQQPQSGSSSCKNYAGGKILCILGTNAPTEVNMLSSKRRAKNGTRTTSATTQVGAGGFGGSCACTGQRYESRSSCGSPQPLTTAAGNQYDNDPELGQANINVVEFDQEAASANQESDLTAANLSRAYGRRKSNKYSSSPLQEPELYYSELGQQCAHAGLGVDILVLAAPSPTAITSTNSLEKVQQSLTTNAGIPLLRQLSDRSGAPGPIVCTNAAMLQAEIQSRIPWNPSIVFGGKLRIRLSPGFAVDTSPVEGGVVDGDDADANNGPQLAPLYASGGLMGPATADEEEDGLWTMGCCDTSTAVTIDLTINHRSTVKDRTHIDGIGECMIKHAIQTCFAYTAIEEQEDGSFVTVRRMQVANVQLPLAHDTESLYSTLDPEALAVVLFHKLTIASLQDGLVQTHEIGQQWLQSLMTCVYRSAEEEERLQEEQISRGLDNMNPVFFPQERLLNRNGEHSAEGVLLGLGHERLGAVPLIVFALLQCDALRPSMGCFRPSIDARSAASAQMYSMLPSVLARCVAPRFELWSSGEDVREPIMEDMELNLEHVGLSLMEHHQTAGDGDLSDLIVFVDSPREVVVCDSRHLQPTESTSKVMIGKGLERSIKIAAGSYRVPPPIVYELDLSSSSSLVSPLARIKDVLMEDSQTVQGLQNYAQWRQDVAGMVQEGLER